MGVELTGVVVRELGSEINEVVFWTDSISVLQYVRSTVRQKGIKPLSQIALQLFRPGLSPRNGGMCLPKVIPLILRPEG